MYRSFKILKESFVDYLGYWKDVLNPRSNLLKGERIIWIDVYILLSCTLYLYLIKIGV